ncbi:hypothetical protein BD309DRAFT_965620 [Dichomitus squalens]|nr:hypothetical protein BD309DRAFT_965620 [Dichomitus squalens]
MSISICSVPPRTLPTALSRSPVFNLYLHMQFPPSRAFNAYMPPTLPTTNRLSRCGHTPSPSTNFNVRSVCHASLKIVNKILVSPL